MRLGSHPDHDGPVGLPGEVQPIPLLPPVNSIPLTSSGSANDRRPTADDRSYALAASWLPKGRKYCVPLIGAETFLRSSCKSSLRSTKSISEVLTISRSEEV